MSSVEGQDGVSVQYSRRRRSRKRRREVLMVSSLSSLIAILRIDFLVNQEFSPFMTSG
jgi:hypothetical protein